MAYIISPKRRLVRRRVRRGMGDVAPKGGVPILTAPTRLGVPCDATGQYTLQNGQWRRLMSGEVCSSTSGVAPGHENTSGGGGVAVTETVCLQPDASIGIKIDLNSPGFLNYDGDPPPPINIILSATEGAGVEYAFFCVDPNKISLTREQRQAVVWALTGATTAHGHAYPWQAFTDGDRVDANQVVYGYPGRWWKDVVAGESPIAVFTSPADGDTKNVYVTITGDPRNPIATFRWAHRATAFQTIDSFLESLSPVSTEQLCSMLPIASKVPNPYVAVGSIVLQMSGKCPPTCPGGMLYDDKTKTCACPPGSQFNIAANACQAGALGADDWLMPAIIGGGVLLALFAITSPRKKKKEGA
jgi:hypothetical protein